MHLRRDGALMAVEKTLLTAKDKADLMPVVRGEYPPESALAVVETIVREHVGRERGVDLG